jgi:hypothetical protein
MQSKDKDKSDWHHSNANSQYAKRTASNVAYNLRTLGRESWLGIRLYPNQTNQQPDYGFLARYILSKLFFNKEIYCSKRARYLILEYRARLTFFYRHLFTPFHG